MRERLRQGRSAFLLLARTSVSEIGGAMAEIHNKGTQREEEANGQERQKKAIFNLEEVMDDPEDEVLDNALLEHMASKADRIVARNLLKVITCIGTNVVDKTHAPSVRVLFEIAGRVTTKKPIRRDEYRSFAETLWGGMSDDDEEDDE